MRTQPFAVTGIYYSCTGGFLGEKPLQISSEQPYRALYGLKQHRAEFKPTCCCSTAGSSAGGGGSARQHGSRPQPSSGNFHTCFITGLYRCQKVEPKRRGTILRAGCHEKFMYVKTQRVGIISALVLRCTAPSHGPGGTDPEPSRQRVSRPLGQLEELLLLSAKIQLGTMLFLKQICHEFIF